MNKLFGKVFILTFMLTGVFLLLFSQEPAYAISNISDGGGAIPTSAFRSFGGSIAKISW